LLVLVAGNETTFSLFTTTGKPGTVAQLADARLGPVDSCSENPEADAGQASVIWLAEGTILNEGKGLTTSEPLT